MPEIKSPESSAEQPARPRLGQKARYVPHSAPEEFIVPVLRREIESCLEAYAKPSGAGAKAIDVGCGAQPFKSALEDLGYSYFSVDASPNDAPVDAICAIDGPLPREVLQRGPFDFLLCTEVLEHVADWHAAFANFDLLLSRGGRALLTAPHFYQLHEEPYDFWRPTLHAIDYYSDEVKLLPIYRSPAGDGWDLLGTLLANCQFAPATSRFGDRIAAQAARIAKRAIFGLLLERRLQRRVRVDAPLYLCNVVVLEKPTSGQAPMS